MTSLAILEGVDGYLLQAHREREHHAYCVMIGSLGQYPSQVYVGSNAQDSNCKLGLIEDFETRTDLDVFAT